MQQHLRDENLPEAVMPACPITKCSRARRHSLTGANSGIGRAVALALGTPEPTCGGIMFAPGKQPKQW